MATAGGYDARACQKSSTRAISWPPGARVGPTSPHFKFAKLIINLIKTDKREANVREEWQWQDQYLSRYPACIWNNNVSPIYLQMEKFKCGEILSYTSYMSYSRIRNLAILANIVILNSCMHNSLICIVPDPPDTAAISRMVTRQGHLASLPARRFVY